MSGEVLGQGAFRYRANSSWGQLDRTLYPVKDCHGIAEDRGGRIVLLTNETRNNLITYDKGGQLITTWEHRFPGAHGLDIIDRNGQDQYWITDHTLRIVSVCDAGGQEQFRVTCDDVASRYADITKYRPTGTATMPDGDFFIADGYGSSFIHHFDPGGQLIASFGGEGPAPENLKTPHSVWIDQRKDKPELLVCDRGHNALKWFSTAGDLLRVLDLGPIMADNEVIGVLPCNVAPFGGYRGVNVSGHIAVACFYGVVLILDRNDRIVALVGGTAPQFGRQSVEQLEVANRTLNHPHDVYVDAAGAIYVSQWGPNRTYPMKLEPIGDLARN